MSGGKGKMGEWKGRGRRGKEGGLPVIYLDKVDEVGLDKSSMCSAKVCGFVCGYGYEGLDSTQGILYHACLLQPGSVLVALGCVSSGTS
jgi:hypothetical protein